MSASSRTIRQEIAHLRFMVGWWSGEVFTHYRDDAKAQAARDRLADLVGTYGHV